MEIYNRREKIFLGIAVFFGCIGLIVLISFIISIYYSYSIFNGKLDMTATGQVGDYIGGIVGTFWSAASILLFYVTLSVQVKEFQKTQEELRRQRQQLEEQKKEAQFQRLTNVVTEYVLLSLKKIEKLKLRDLTLDGRPTITQGEIAFVFLSHRFKTLRSFQLEKTMDDEKKANEKKLADMLHTLINRNSIIWTVLFNTIFSYCKTLKNLFEMSDVDPDMQKLLFNMYITSLGTEFLGALDELTTNINAEQIEMYDNTLKISICDLQSFFCQY